MVNVCKYRSNTFNTMNMEGGLFWSVYCTSWQLCYILLRYSQLVHTDTDILSVAIVHCLHVQVKYMYVYVNVNKQTIN